MRELPQSVRRRCRLVRDLPQFSLEDDRAPRRGERLPQVMVKALGCGEISRKAIAPHGIVYDPREFRRALETTTSPSRL